MGLAFSFPDFPKLFFSLCLRITVNGVNYHSLPNVLSVPEKLVSAEWYEKYLSKLAWKNDSTLDEMKRAIQCQLLFLKAEGLSSPDYFFELFDYEARADFAMAHLMLAWHKFDPATHINLENVELPKPKHHLARNMKLRFPATSMMHHHMRNPPAGLEDPNFVAAYDLATALMRKELNFGQEEVSYTLERNTRIQQRCQTDPSEKKRKRWVGNPVFADLKTYDSLATLAQVRTFTFTPEKFKYVLGAKGDFSFAQLLKNIVSGNINFKQSEERVALLAHIMGAKDSMFEGVLEWLEMLVPLIAPASLPEEHQLFFSQIADSMARVQDGYKLLNKKLFRLLAVSKGETLTDFQIKAIMSFLTQHFPLKDLGAVLEDRKRTIIKPDYIATYPTLYKKAFGNATQTQFKPFSQPSSQASSSSGNFENFGLGSLADVQDKLSYANRTREKTRQKNKRQRLRKKRKRETEKDT